MRDISSLWNVTGRLNPSFSLTGPDLLRCCLKFLISQCHWEFTVYCLHNANTSGRPCWSSPLWTEKRNAGALWSHRVRPLTCLCRGMWITLINTPGIDTNIYKSHFPCKYTRMCMYMHIAILKVLSCLWLLTSSGRWFKSEWYSSVMRNKLQNHAFGLATSWLFSHGQAPSTFLSLKGLVNNTIWSNTFRHEW